MNNLVLLTAFVLVSSVCAIPLPQDLTIAEFRSLRDEETPSQKVQISSSYAQVNMHLDIGNVLSYYIAIRIHMLTFTETHLFYFVTGQTTG